MKSKTTAPRKAMSIFDFHCEKCEKAGRNQPVQLIMGAATKGKYPDSSVICGTCDSIIYEYLPEEMIVNQVGPHGDNEEFRSMMAGEKVGEEE